jgi:hypothetical protein
MGPKGKRLLRLRAIALALRARLRLLWWLREIVLVTQPSPPFITAARYRACASRLLCKEGNTA